MLNMCEHAGRSGILRRELFATHTAKMNRQGHDHSRLNQARTQVRDLTIKISLAVDASESEAGLSASHPSLKMIAASILFVVWIREAVVASGG